MEALSLTGAVTSFNPSKGFGFIAAESGADIFLHVSNCTDGGEPRQGDTLKFDIEPSPKNPGQMQAINITGGSGVRKGGGKSGGNGGGKADSRWGAPVRGAKGSLVDMEALRQQSAAAQDMAAMLQEAKRCAKIGAIDSEDAPVVSTEEASRFALDDPEALQHLSDQGYVVLANVLDDSEVRSGHDLLWDFLPAATADYCKANSGWKRGNMQSWKQGYNWLKDDWGIFKNSGAGQCDMVWFVRTRPSVRRAFSHLWGTDNLISAFDGFNIFLPWQHGFAKTKQGWLHTDQGYDKKGLHAIQGFVSLTDQHQGTGGLHVIPASHHVHEIWTKNHPDTDGDFCRINRSEFCGALQLLPQRLVTCKAGDLVLWDSRLIHCNMPAPQEPMTPAGQLLRVAVYVSLTPRCLQPNHLRTEEELRLRRLAYNEGASCNHWGTFSKQMYHAYMRNAGDFKVQPLNETTDGRCDLI